MRSRQKLFDYLILLGVAIAVYLLLSFGISGLRIKLDAEPFEYFISSISHMFYFKAVISLLTALILPTLLKLMAILLASRKADCKMTLRNIRTAFRYQLPPHRSIANFFVNFFVTHNGLGMFSINSHVNQRNGKEKVSYSSFESAKKAADKMGQKHNTHFSVYKCTYCDGFHIGRNRDNK